MLGEVPEIRVSRDERCVVIEAGLRDQSISESCPPLLSEDSRPGGTGSLPEAGLNLERGKIENELCHLALQSRSTQDLGEDDRRQHRQFELESLIHRLYVAPSVAIEERDQRAGIECDQCRSSRRPSRSIVIGTLPRSASSLL